jgi:hypothetical protein
MTSTELAAELLEELRTHGPSRATDVVEAFVELEGCTVREVLDGLNGLALAGSAEVRIIQGIPFWAAKASSSRRGAA